VGGAGSQLNIKVKKRCCKSSPRCKRCPVVARRLESAGLAERTGKRTWIYRARKKTLKAARRRKGPRATLKV
jgi:hypothetical protein